MNIADNGFCSNVCTYLFSCSLRSHLTGHSKLRRAASIARWPGRPLRFNRIFRVKMLGAINVDPIGTSSPSECYLDFRQTWIHSYVILIVSCMDAVELVVLIPQILVQVYDFWSRSS